MLLVLGLGIFYAYIEVQRTSLALRAEETARTHTQQQERFNKLSAELSPDAAAQAVDAESKELEKNIAARQAMLAELRAGSAEASAGYSAFLSAFARRPLSGVWLTGIHVDAGGGQMTVKGRATSAELLPEYIQLLGLEPVLKGRPFERLELSRRELAAGTGKPVSSFVEFSLVSSAEPVNAVNAPLPAEPQPQQSKVN